MLPVVFIIEPGIIQTSSEQTVHKIAAVIAPANAKLVGLIFIIFNSCELFLTILFAFRR